MPSSFWFIVSNSALFCGLVHISEKIMPEVTAWQNRPLETVYPFVFLDAIHYKVKENHPYQTKLGYSEYLFRISHRDSENHIHDEYH